MYHGRILTVLSYTLILKSDFGRIYILSISQSKYVYNIGTYQLQIGGLGVTR